MKIAFFDTHVFERDGFERANRAFGHEICFFEARLTFATAKLASQFPVVCSFVNDVLDLETLTILKEEGVRLIALRSAGFNHVDLKAAKHLGLTVVRVPAYSPYAVAEHAVALLLSLNRKIHRAYQRVREGNFSLDGLIGFDLRGKTVGIIGTGRIGSVFARIMKGFGCEIIAYDVKPDPKLVENLGVRYTSLDELYRDSDVLSLHLPLFPDTRHLIDEKALGKMKRGAVLINTSRGALVDTSALIQALKKSQIAAAGLDVYEEEEGVFFEDLSNQMIQDDQLARLLTFPNVLITAHQGFLTREALDNIAKTTLQNIHNFDKGVGAGDALVFAP